MNVAKYRIPLVLLSLASCFGASCGEDITEPEHVTLSQDVTINTRNVQQTRGALNRAVLAPNEPQASLEYHLAVSSGATGFIEKLAWKSRRSRREGERAGDVQAAKVIA